MHLNYFHDNMYNIFKIKSNLYTRLALSTQFLSLITYRLIIEPEEIYLSLSVQKYVSGLLFGPSVVSQNGYFRLILP